MDARWIARQEDALARLRQALDDAVAGPAAGDAGSATEHRVLADIFAGRVPWQARALPALVQFARVRGRAQQPPVSVGDALTALGAVLARARPPGHPLWRFEPAVDQSTFDLLGFASVSAGIGRAAREHREGWWQHARASKTFILEAVTRLPSTRLAVVLGAGQAHGLPLRELASAFERLVLVDIDGAALARTVEDRLADPTLRARVETRVADVTGINGRAARALDGAIAGAAGPDEAQAGVFAVCRGYGLETPPRFLGPGEQADLLISDLLVSQLALALRSFARSRFEARFGPVPRSAEASWVEAWAELGLRLQQDHLGAVVDQAARAIVTADVVQRQTALDPAGNERPTGVAFSELGVERLADRIPGWLAIETSASWRWPRYRARRGAPGAVMDVDAVLVRPAGS